MPPRASGSRIPPADDVLARALVVFVLLLWLLSEILLPFVAGLAIAYLLNPLVDRIERVGINRLVAALSIIALAVLAFVVLILLVAPILGGQLSSFIDNIPGYVTKLQTAAHRSKPALGAEAPRRRLQCRKRGSAIWSRKAPAG